MKLDRDLVRELLLFLESKEDTAARDHDQIEIAGYTSTDIGYTLTKMHEAGFIVAETLRSRSTPERVIKVIPFELTYQGHEFLDSIRDPEVWRRTKEAGAKVGGAGIEVMWEIAKGIGKQMIKERLGIDIA